MSNILKGLNTQKILREGISQQDLADTLFYRLEYRYPDIVSRYGMEVVGSAVMDVADFHAGAEELGTSDINIMLKQILKQLEDYPLDEAQGDISLDPETALYQARKITKQYKYADMHTDIVMQIQQLAEKAGIHPKELQYYVDEVYAKQRELESAIYALDEVFEEHLQQSQNDIDEGQIYAQGGGYGEGQRWYRPKDNLGEGIEMSENLRKWFKEKWVRFGPDGKIRGDCARGDDSEGKPKCLPQAKAHALGKKGRKYAASKKRREDPNPERRGPAKNVATKKKSNEGVAEGSDAEAYKEKLLATLPQMLRFYEKNVEGWKPSEEQMLAAVETGYMVMKHTGDVKQAGKAVMDELNTLHRMSQGQQGVAEEQLDEKCWDTHKQVGMKKKGDKMVPNCVPKESIEEEQKCPECGGAMFSDLMLAEKKDACYNKVRSRYKVWPSAYASGALVQCRKKGAKNWGTGGKKNEGMVMGVSSDANSAGTRVQGEAANPKQQAAIAIAMKKAGQKPKRESAIMKGLVDETLGIPYPGTYEQETAPFRTKGPRRMGDLTNE